MYFYKKGEFLNAFEAETTPNIYRLWSLMYTADKRLISHKILSFIHEEQKKNNNGLWDRRAYLYIQVLALTSNEYENFLTAVGKFDRLVNADIHDGYFFSLGQYLNKLATAPRPTFKSCKRNTHLIGDSHCLAVSPSWNFDKGLVTFLPAVTTRELSSRLKQPAHYGFENAIRIAQSDRLVFSIGEIDQREIYGRIEAYLLNASATKDRIKLQIRQSIASLHDMVSPFQDAYVLAMPPFFESLVPEKLKHRSDEIREWIEWFGATFAEEAEKQGFGVFGKEKMRSAGQQDLIDHAHFKPGFYENFFD